MFIEISMRPELAAPSCDPVQRPGTDQEFADFLTSVQREALSITRYRVNCSDAAPDIVQDAIVTFMQYRESHSVSRESFKPLFFYMLKIKTLQYFDLISKRKKREVFFCDLAPNNEDSDDFDFFSVYDSAGGTATHESPMETLERKQIAAIIMREVKTLTPRQREALLTWEDLSHSQRQTAEIMGICATRVGDMVRIAKHKLAPSLQCLMEGQS